MLGTIKSILTKVHTYIQGICNRAMEVDSVVPKTEPPVARKLEFVPVQVTHFVPKHNPWDTRRRKQQDFRVWQENNKLLFG